MRGHLASPRKEITDIVGKEMLLYRSPSGRESEAILSMDLPFVIFIPYGRGGEEIARRVPPASLQLDKRTAETYYEIMVTVQHGHSEQRKHYFPVPITRYDTLSTFGMYNRPEAAERVADHLITLGISLPRWSYGPLDPVSVYIKLSPNPDQMHKAKKVTIKTITVSIEEEIIFNHEGDEPQRKTKTLSKHQQSINVRMPEAGFFTNMGLVFPARELRDSEGILPRSRREFPMYAVTGFTTTGTLYKIEYYLVVKVRVTITGVVNNSALSSPSLLPTSYADTNTRRRQCRRRKIYSSANRSWCVRSTMPGVRRKWRPSSRPQRMRLMSARIIRCCRRRRLLGITIRMGSERSALVWLGARRNR